MKRVFIGLGSNLGDRDANLAEARDHISANGFVIIAESGIDETAPVEVVDQPHFLNQVVETATFLEPAEILSTLLDIEEKMGRVRTVPKGPRIIDLDVLLIDGSVFSMSDLTVPHPGIVRRTFVLRHLIEIDYMLQDPVSGRLYSEILDGLYC